MKLYSHGDNVLTDFSSVYELVTQRTNRETRNIRNQCEQ